MANVEHIVDAAIRAAGVPILGVSFPDLTNRASWVVQFDPSATPAQKATAATILQTVVIDTAAQVDDDAMSQADQKLLRAIVLGLWETIPGPLMTKVQLRARIIALYKSFL